jgi:peptidoglycan/LPS O-acetylase OafA/YrhL
VALSFAGTSKSRPQKIHANPGAAEATLPQIPALTGLRFFAAFFILFSHAVDWLAPFQDSNIGAKLAFVAMYGMPLFFVLSGYVIHYNYRRLFIKKGMLRATCEFAAARFARLYPLYFLLVLVAICADNFISKVYNSPELLLSILSYFLTLTQSWWYVVYSKQLLINWLFPLSWSISTEMFFYAAYVAVVFLIIPLRSARIAAIVALGFALTTMMLFMASRRHLSEILDVAQRRVPDFIDADGDFQHSYYRWLFYFSPYARVFEFFLGCLAAHASVLIQSRKISLHELRFANLGLIVSLASLASAGALYLGAGGLPAVNLYVRHLALNFLCAPAISFVLFYVGRYSTAFTRFLSSPVLVALGDTSYSIYLIHTWTLRVFIHPAPVLNWIWAIDAALRVLFGIAFTLLAAYATYQLIEVPSRFWLRRKFGHAIALSFGVERSEVPIDSSLKAQHRMTFSFAATTLLILIAVVGQLAQSEALWAGAHRFWVGERPEVSIISATYGLNCRKFSVPAPYTNLAVEGNVTRSVERACNLRQRCNYRVSNLSIGDPANGCGKDFSVQYRCTGSEAIRSAFIPAEADGKGAILDCLSSK